jgi:hypothetical protein
MGRIWDYATDLCVLDADEPCESGFMLVHYS